MLRFAADENLNSDIVRGILRRRPNADVVEIRDVGLSGASDQAVLEWAARENRVLLTHDVSTMVRFAFERVRSGKHMPGVFEIARSISIARVIDDLILLLECSDEGEWEGQVRYLPLR